MNLCHGNIILEEDKQATYIVGWGYARPYQHTYPLSLDKILGTIVTMHYLDSSMKEITTTIYDSSEERERER
jgi:hypothetical protein